MGSCLTVRLSPPAPIGEIDPACDFDLFDCGEPTLDHWLRRHARSSEGKTARTYCVAAGGRLAVYCCVAAGSVQRHELPKALTRNTPEIIPTIVVGRLAVDRSFQGQGLGQDLVRHVLRQGLSASAAIGVRAVIVHPLTEALTPFYRRLGFIDMPGDPLGMFIAIETIAKTL